MNIRMMIRIALPILACLSLDGFAKEMRALSFSLKPGNLLSIIEPYGNQGKAAQDARKRYYEVAINLARQYGFQNRGTLRVTETLLGEKHPTAFVLATWPDMAADDTFESLPQWQEYKALRPVIWESLFFYKAPAVSSTTVWLSEEKNYTLVFTWSGDMDTTQTMPAGSSIVHQMKHPRFDTHSAPYQGPDAITLLEWQSESALTAYAETSSRREQKTEIYRVRPVIR